jgi:hypothetical protein
MGVMLNNVDDEGLHSIEGDNCSIDPASALDMLSEWCFSPLTVVYAPVKWLVE